MDEQMSYGEKKRKSGPCKWGRKSQGGKEQKAMIPYKTEITPLQMYRITEDESGSKLCCGRVRTHAAGPKV